jgi:hypothetical protein
LKHSPPRRIAAGRIYAASDMVREVAKRAAEALRSCKSTERDAAGTRSWAKKL